MTLHTIAVSLNDGILSVTLNRPDSLNAISTEMADELTGVLNAAGDARVVLLSAVGRAFCAGADLGSAPDSPVDAAASCELAMRQHYNPLMAALMDLRIPLVVAVNGPALGIGCSVALTGDFVFAASSAYFTQAFVNIGLVPDGGASWMLPRLVGKARATELMMLGERLPAPTAENWGLIHRCVPDGTVIEAAAAMARRIAVGPTVALGLIRQNLRVGQEKSFHEVLECEARAQCEAASTTDAAEGARAFFAKCLPQFKGN